MDNVFAIYRGKGKKKKIKVNKRSKIKRALYVKSLTLMAYMSNLADLVFSEFWISERLYRKLKDEADQIVMEYEREDYDEELMVF